MIYESGEAHFMSVANIFHYPVHLKCTSLINRTIWVGKACRLQGSNIKRSCHRLISRSILLLKYLMTKLFIEKCTRHCSTQHSSLAADFMSVLIFFIIPCTFMHVFDKPIGIPMVRHVQ